jgi:hypothetical protein
MASQEQVAAFETAAKPVFDTIEQDPQNAEFVAAIRELKTKTTPSLGAEACEPATTQASPEPVADTQVWSQGMPPNGVWQVELTPEDFVQMGMLRSVAESDWAGLQTLTLKDGKSVGVWHGLQGQTAKCQADYEVVGDVVRFTYYSDADECVGQVDEVQWRLDGDGLHFRVVAFKNVDAIGMKTYYEAKPWQKIADK